jgi:Glycosyl transferase family 2
MSSSRNDRASRLGSGRVTSSEQNPRVSIGLPVFNGERFMEAAIDSILGQTFEDFELIISDNASTDRTPEICSLYAKKDDRIRYVRNRDNYGPAFNFNQTFRLSTGEYFKWAAHDDVVLPRFLETCVGALDENSDVAIAYSQWWPIDDKGDRIDMNYPSWCIDSSDPVERFRSAILLFGGIPLPIFGLNRSSVLRRTRLQRPIFAGDCIFVAEMSIFGPFFEVAERLMCHRYHADMSSRIPSMRGKADWWLSTTRGRSRSPGPLSEVVAIPRTLVSVAASLVDSLYRSPLSAHDRLRCSLAIPVGLGNYIGRSIWRRVPHPPRRSLTAS